MKKILVFIAISFFLYRRIVQLSSAIWPREIKDELFKLGRTAACFALDDKSGDKGSSPISVD